VGYLGVPLFITGRLPFKLGGAAYRHLQRRLLQHVVNNVVINNVTAATLSATTPPDRYVRHISICLAMDVVFFALLLFILINASSMFEFHMLVVVVIMFNILELIMKFLPNYPTVAPILEDISIRWSILCS
jgi:hypothetical protein